jgi:hypothetical protein
MFDNRLDSIFSSDEGTKMVSIETQLPPRSAVVSPRGPSGCESDQLIVARLAGAAQRHAPWREPTAAQRHALWREPTTAETAAAVAELREIAGARADLLAEAAGLLTGFYRGTSEEARARAAAHYCVVAGARREEIPHWIEVGRSRAAAARQVSDAGQRHRRDDLGAST